MSKKKDNISLGKFATDYHKNKAKQRKLAQDEERDQYGLKETMRIRKKMREDAKKKKENKKDGYFSKIYKKYVKGE